MLDQLTLGQLLCLTGGEESEEITYDDACDMIEEYRRKQKEKGVEV